MQGSGLVEQTYFRWLKEHGGLQVEDAKRFKELEQEKAKLKRLMAELSLDKLVLKDILASNNRGRMIKVFRSSRSGA